eukprot:708588_1
MCRIQDMAGPFFILFCILISASLQSKSQGKLSDHIHFNNPVTNEFLTYGFYRESSEAVENYFIPDIADMISAYNSPVVVAEIVFGTLLSSNAKKNISELRHYFQNLENVSMWVLYGHILDHAHATVGISREGEVVVSIWMDAFSAFKIPNDTLAMNVDLFGPSSKHLLRWFKLDDQQTPLKICKLEETKLKFGAGKELSLILAKKFNDKNQLIFARYF